MMILEATDRLPNKRTKMVAFADDFSAGGILTNLKHYWLHLLELGPQTGYHPQASKCWLIVKPEHLAEAEKIFEGTSIQITTEGNKHLGAVIGTEDYRDQYVTQKLDKLESELVLLSEIAKIDPQSAYCCFVTGFRNKFSYLMRTIPNIADMMKRIDDVVSNIFIPAITGGIVVNDNQRKLLSLPVKMGGMAIPIFSELSDNEYNYSTSVTENLVNQIVKQERTYTKDPEMSSVKNGIKKNKHQRNEKLLNELQSTMSDDEIRLLAMSSENGASTWLSTLPLTSENYQLTKQNFWDLIRFRYGWQLSRLPSTCECGVTFSIEHALTCKKGGFISLRHNEVRNLTANLLGEVCKDVCIEPTLLPFTGEEINGALTTDNARADVCARGFWTSGQLAFLDVRVFNPLAKRFRSSDLPNCYKSNEREKKKLYNDRINQIDHGTFTPLVFSASGGMGRECKKFYDHLAELLSEKRKESYSVTCTWVRRKLSFALIKSINRCIRGSRTIYSSANNQLETNTFDIKSSENISSF